ncbi:hypothetical protein BVRB_4g081050 [Beta vulgaris subsp. vulgaris]|nr:hypothetical protein BVRB_4g081050 [Beta vulgaris subsp. vulgaris]
MATFVVALSSNSHLFFSKQSFININRLLLHSHRPPCSLDLHIFPPTPLSLSSLHSSNRSAFPLILRHSSNTDISKLQIEVLGTSQISVKLQI